MKTICVTGGCGFLGSAVVRALLDRKIHVRIIDDYSRGQNTFEGGPELWKAKVENIENLNMLSGVDCVIHMAAINGTKNFYERPGEVLRVSIEGTLAVLKACRKWKVKDMIFVSSSEVYHDPSIIPTPECTELVIPDVHNKRYSYSGGKIAGELLTLHMGGEFLNRAIVVRPHNIIGPNAGEDHVIPTLMRRFKGKEGEIPEVPIQGTGKETRSFCYIDDFVKGLLLVLDHGLNGEVYNIGRQDEVSINGLIKMMGVVFGCKDVKINPSGETMLGSPTRRCPDMSKLQELGYKSEVDLPTALIKIKESIG